MAPPAHLLGLFESKSDLDPHLGQLPNTSNDTLFASEPSYEYVGCL